MGQRRGQFRGLHIEFSVQSPFKQKARIKCLYPALKGPLFSVAPRAEEYHYIGLADNYQDKAMIVKRLGLGWVLPLQMKELGNKSILLKELFE